VVHVEAVEVDCASGQSNIPAVLYNVTDQTNSQFDKCASRY